MKENKMQKKSLVSSSSRSISSKSLKHMTPLKSLIQRSRPPASQLAFFLVEVAALEVVRRFSRSKCPLVWKGIQTLQILCYPPFKWLGKWSPIKMMIENVQRISKPLLLLSIATAFSEHSESSEHILEHVDDTQPNCEIARTSSDSDTSEDSSKDEPESWMIQLIRELNKQGIDLPERINEDELQRFYDAANGDFSCLIPSLKRTIRWRETYHILPLQELENWSHLVFWHGFDVMLRPCLVIRLGLACSNLVPHERPRFAQAVVSQVEHGILHLINEDDPRITVLMDCDGISPFRFPMQMMRSCTAVVQDNYPNRLASLIVIRLPPVVRVLAQTLIQILKPTTRRKLRIEGESYKKALSEFLHTVPAFLGGSCSCSQCQRLFASKSFRQSEGTSRRQPCVNLLNNEAAGNEFPVYEGDRNNECDHYLRAAIVSFLMIWVVIAFLVGLYDPETFSALSHEI